MDNPNVKQAFVSQVNLMFAIFLHEKYLQTSLHYTCIDGGIFLPWPQFNQFGKKNVHMHNEYLLFDPFEKTSSNN